MPEPVRVSIIVPSDQLDVSVTFWTAVLGPATFVDGQRWAQFDAGSTRLSIGADAERPSATAVAIQVVDLDTVRAQLVELGAVGADMEDGPHERRCTMLGPSGESIVLYERPSPNA